MSAARSESALLAQRGTGARAPQAATLCQQTHSGYRLDLKEKSYLQAWEKAGGGSPGPYKLVTQPGSQTGKYHIAWSGESRTGD